MRLDRRLSLRLLVSISFMFVWHFAAQAQESELSGSDSPAQLEDLPSPTKSIEAYEEARNERLRQTGIPDWAISAGMELSPFGNADLRVPNPAVGSSQANDGKPELTGIIASFERFAIRDYGLLSAGINTGVFISKAKEPFDKMRPAMWSVAPTVHYEFNYFHKQVLVPSIRFDYQFVRYAYNYRSSPVRGVKRVPRIDLGMMFYLNIFEPLQGGLMQSNWGIKRTYLAGYYSIARDSVKEDFDAAGKTWKVALRFEF